MKSVVATIMICAACVPSAGVATAGEASIPEETVSGRIIDITCYGPCAPGTNPRPFEGEADVVVTERKTGNQIASVSVKGPRYSLLVPPGRYRIVAVPYPNVPTICWLSYSRRLHVVSGQAQRKRLLVENGCVQ